MGKKVYLGVSSKAHNVKKLYLGVSGKAHKVKKGFIGVNGKAHQFFSSGIWAEYHGDGNYISEQYGYRNYFYLGESPGNYDSTNTNCNGPSIGHTTSYTACAGTVDSICKGVSNGFNIYKAPGLTLSNSNVKFGGDGLFQNRGGMTGSGNYIILGNVKTELQHGRYDRVTGAQLAVSGLNMPYIRGGSVNEKYFDTQGEKSALTFSQVRAISESSYTCDADGSRLYYQRWANVYGNWKILDYSTLSVITEKNLTSGIKSLKSVMYMKGEYPA